MPSPYEFANISARLFLSIILVSRLDMKSRQCILLGVSTKSPKYCLWQLFVVIQQATACPVVECYQFQPMTMTETEPDCL